MSTGMWSQLWTPNILCPIGSIPEPQLDQELQHPDNGPGVSRGPQRSFLSDFYTIPDIRANRNFIPELDFVLFCHLLAKHGSEDTLRDWSESPEVLKIGSKCPVTLDTLMSLSVLCQEFLYLFQVHNGPLRSGGPWSPPRHSKEAPDVLPHLTSFL